VESRARRGGSDPDRTGTILLLFIYSTRIVHSESYISTTCSTVYCVYIHTWVDIAKLAIEVAILTKQIKGELLTQSFAF
jgi:hypothetical protein